MIAAFEPITADEEARRQLRTFTQTGRVSGYVTKFRELQYKLPEMTAAEAFSAFVAGLKPAIRQHVGAHVHGDLAAAMEMALRQDLFQTAETDKTKENKDKKKTPGKKGNVTSIEGEQSGGAVNEVTARGRGGRRNPGRRGRGRGRGRGGRNPTCFCCGGNHLMKDCQEWQTIRNHNRPQPQQSQPQGN